MFDMNAEIAAMDAVIALADIEINRCSCTFFACTHSENGKSCMNPGNPNLTIPGYGAICDDCDDVQFAY